MKGAMFRREKPVEAFEAHGATIPAAEDAARAKAEKIWQRLKAKRPGGPAQKS
jgi:creatinine amidohydrolase/Fe(II)-dependent formamide hydrolase-like protein